MYYKNSVVTNIIVEQKIILDWHGTLLTPRNKERRKYVVHYLNQVFLVEFVIIINIIILLLLYRIIYLYISLYYRYTYYVIQSNFLEHCFFKPFF